MGHFVAEWDGDSRHRVDKPERSEVVRAHFELSMGGNHGDSVLWMSLLRLHSESPMRTNTSERGISVPPGIAPRPLTH